MARQHETGIAPSQHSVTVQHLQTTPASVMSQHSSESITSGSTERSGRSSSIGDHHRAISPRRSSAPHDLAHPTGRRHSLGASSQATDEGEDPLVTSSSSDKQHTRRKHKKKSKSKSKKESSKKSKKKSGKRRSSSVPANMKAPQQCSISEEGDDDDDNILPLPNLTSATSWDFTQEPTNFGTFDQSRSTVNTGALSNDTPTSSKNDASAEALEFAGMFAEDGFDALIQSRVDDAAQEFFGGVDQQQREVEMNNTSSTRLSTQTPISAAPTAKTESMTLSPPSPQPLEQAPPAQKTEGVVVGDFAKEQGERFQDYLKASGQIDEKLAAATAEAFQAFLASHVAKPEGARGEIMAGCEIGGAAFADDVSELGNSVMGGDWDNGTFVSYTTMQQEQQARQQRQQKKLTDLQMAGGSGIMNHAGGEWGEIKRNENFVRKRNSVSHGSTEGAEPTPAQSPPPPPPPPPQVQQPVHQYQRPLSTYGSLHGDNHSISQSSHGSVSTDHTSSTTASASIPFHEQWASLSKDERSCVSQLKRKWERRYPKQKYADKWYLQFALCSPGKPFNVKTAYRVMKGSKRHFLDMCDAGMTQKMEDTMLTKTMFPCAGLKTKGGHDVNYVRPSRYFPNERPIVFMKEISMFIMNHRLEKVENCLNGICVLVNMKGWTMRNFSVAYLHMVCMMIQGFLFPTRIAAFHFVDSPAWFGSIWSMMKPMLAPSFRRRVHFFKTSQMPDYFAPGFERYLPDDMYGGQANTDGVIRDFIELRKRIDAERKSKQPPSTRQ